MWIAGGAKDALARAHEYVEKVTANYREAEPVCSSKQFDQLCRIVETARSEVSAA